MDLVKGRDFSDENKADTANYVINEVLAEIIGFENPVGQDLNVWGVDGKVIGVVKDFHMDSMYEPIAPLIVRFDPGNSHYMAFIRIQGDTRDALIAIEKVTKNLDPKSPFNYGFLDEEYEQTYQSESRLSNLVIIFAIMALFISCLGIFGLSSYSAEQRSREIGIRKVHGADVFQLLLMLFRDYTVLILIAFVISVPIATYYMQNWLDRFTFRTDINAWMFILAGTVAFIIAVLTISFKSYQAATTNPVDTLNED
jgi:putative ABC transport system permease protein